MKQLHVYSNGQWIATGGADLSGYPTTQYVDSKLQELGDAVSPLVTEVAALNQFKIEVEAAFQDLSSASQVNINELAGTKADLNNPAQTIVAKNFQGEAYFLGATDRAIMVESVSGVDRPVYKAGIETFAFAYARELQGLAKVTDLEQVITTKSIIAQGFAFDQQNVIKIHDTGEGYGPRVSYITESGGNLSIELFVFKSDLDSVFSELQGLTADVQSLSSSVENAISGGWKNLGLLPGWSAVAGKTPQYRVIGDSIEFRGEFLAANGLLDTDTNNNFGVMMEEDKIASTTTTLVPSSGGAAGGIATLSVRNDRILQISPRIVKASTFNINSKINGVR